MRKLTNEEFIKRAQLVHGDTYDYSNVKYTSCKIPLKIICKIHGEFLQLAYSHLYGNGCMLCGRILTNKKRTLTTEIFIKKANIVHKKERYDYSLSVYTKCNEKIKIICNKCKNIFLQRPNDHLHGNGCPTCKFDTLSNLYKRPLDIFLRDANKIHKNKYNYSKVTYKNNKSKINIICP
jgi:hypothetical protein